MRDTSDIHKAQLAQARGYIMTEATALLEPFHRRLCSLFLRHPDEVQYRVEADTSTRVAFIVKPNPDDDGKLIGSKGCMFHSVCLLLQQLCSLHNVQVHYKLDTAKGGAPKRSGGDFVAAKDWPSQRIADALSQTCDAMFRERFELTHHDLPHKTLYELRLHREEPKLVPDAELLDALGCVVHAAGRANGRVIFLEKLERNL